MSEQFTDREKRLIYSAVKTKRHHSEEHAELYEKVSSWALGADEEEPTRQAVRARLAAGSLEMTNDVDFLLGLIDEALGDEENFEDDFERASWAVANWMQELCHEPDISEYNVGENVPKGPVPHREATEHGRD